MSQWYDSIQNPLLQEAHLASYFLLPMLCCCPQCWHSTNLHSSLFSRFQIRDRAKGHLLLTVPSTHLTRSPHLQNFGQMGDKNIYFSVCFPYLCPPLPTPPGLKKMDFPFGIHSPSSWEALSLILGLNDGRAILFILQKKLALEFDTGSSWYGYCRQFRSLEN